MPERIILLGAGIFLVLVLPLLIIRDRRQQRRIKKIIEEHKSGEKAAEKAGASASRSAGSKKDKQKGWGMNNSPFRSRKSGLNWGGGNVHASHAERGDRSRS